MKIHRIASLGLALVLPLAANSQVFTVSTLFAPMAVVASGNAGTFGVGTLSYNDINLITSYAANQNTYVQSVWQNQNAGSSASIDIVVSNNLGTATTYYGNLGMNSSAFSGTGSYNLPNAVYLTSTTGDLAVGSLTGNAVHFFANGSTADAATISSANVLNLFDSTLAIENSADPTKRAVFALGGFPTATTYTYTLPSSSGTLASLNTTQIFTTAQTFNGGINVVGSSTLNGPVNTIGTGTIGGTQNIGTGATSSGNTQTINIGTGGVSGSTTAINLGSANGSSIIVNGALSAAKLITPTYPAGIAGNTGGTTPNAGSVGEYSAAATQTIGSLTSGVSVNVSGYTLTAGDWDVTGAGGYAGAAVGAVTISAGVSTVSATLGATGTYFTTASGSTAITANSVLALPSVRVLSLSSLTVYCVIQVTGTLVSGTDSCTLTARRR